MEIRNTGFPQVAIVISGEGMIRFDDGEMLIRKADEIFLPYNIPGGQIHGNLKMVFCHPEGASIENKQ